MNEGEGEFQQPTNNISQACRCGTYLAFKLITAVVLGGNRRTQLLEQTEKATKNPNHEILPGMQQRESACVYRVCV